MLNSKQSPSEPPNFLHIFDNQFFLLTKQFLRRTNVKINHNFNVTRIEFDY